MEADQTSRTNPTNQKKHRAGNSFSIYKLKPRQRFCQLQDPETETTKSKIHLLRNTIFLFWNTERRQFELNTVTITAND